MRIPPLVSNKKCKLLERRENIIVKRVPVVTSHQESAVLDRIRHVWNAIAEVIVWAARHQGKPESAIVVGVQYIRKLPFDVVYVVRMDIPSNRNAETDTRESSQSFVVNSMKPISTASLSPTRRKRYTYSEVPEQIHFLFRCDAKRPDGLDGKFSRPLKGLSKSSRRGKKRAPIHGRLPEMEDQLYEDLRLE
jgi:hypothetical protein